MRLTTWTCHIHLHSRAGFVNSLSRFSKCLCNSSKALSGPGFTTTFAQKSASPAHKPCPRKAAQCPGRFLRVFDDVCKPSEAGVSCSACRSFVGFSASVALEQMLLQISAVALRVDHWASTNLPRRPDRRDGAKAGSALNSLQRVSPCREPRYTKPLSRDIVLCHHCRWTSRDKLQQRCQSSLTVRPCTLPEPGLAPSSEPNKSRVMSVRSMWRIRCVT